MRILFALALLLTPPVADAVNPPIIWGSPSAKLLTKSLKFGGSETSATCNAAAAGTIRYNAGTFEGCNGSSWSSLGSGSSGTTYTANQYGLAYSSATNATLTILAPDSSTAKALISGGASAAPTWAVVGVAGGGTGIASGTSGGVPYFSGSTTIASSAALTVNQLVLGGGAGAAPVTFAAGSNGQPVVLTAGVPAYAALSLNNSASVTNAWTTYTPTFTGFGTVSTQFFQSMTIGKLMFIWGRFVTGTATAVEARISIPATASSNIPTITGCGNYVDGGFGPTQVFITSVLCEPSVTYITMGMGGNVATAIVKQNGNQFGSAAVMTIQATIPID